MKTISSHLNTVRSCKLPESIRFELWTIVWYNPVSKSHAAGANTERSVPTVFSAVVFSIAKISGHLLWASITTMSIFLWTGPEKSMWSLCQERAGYSYRCRGARTGLFANSWHPSPGADPKNSERGGRVPPPPPPPSPHHERKFTFQDMRHTELWAYSWCKVTLTFRKIELKSIL